MGMNSKRLTMHAIRELAEAVSGNRPEDLLCSHHETPRRQLYGCGWQQCFQLTQIHLQCPSPSVWACPKNCCKPPLANRLELRECERSYTRQTSLSIHFSKQMLHVGIGDCALLSLTYVIGIIYHMTQNLKHVTDGVNMAPHVPSTGNVSNYCF